MYTYVCMHMREGLVTACIDMYESGLSSALTPNPLDSRSMLLLIRVNK